MKKQQFTFLGFIPVALLLTAFVPVGEKPGNTVTTTTTTNLAKTDLRTVKNESFKRGEVLNYRLHYGAIDAGTAEITITDENKQLNDRNTYHVVGVGKTVGAVEPFFKVRDRYESYIDADAMAPVVFIRRVNEGGYKINQDQVFDHASQKVQSNGKTFSVPEYTQDMISAFYYARTLDMSNAKVGDIFSLKSFIDNEIWELQIKFMGRETINTSLGKIRCLKFRPIVQKGRVFKKSEDLNVWISDDKNHVAVRAQADVLIGSVKMDLTSYSNLANPLAIEPK
jgi:hypothetical protein